MQRIVAAQIPKELRSRPQWVLWKEIARDGKKTKVPFSVSGKPARSNDKATWARFEHAWNCLSRYTGLGFVFAPDDPYVGIDLDGCRDPKTGKIADWAQTILDRLQTYSEVSPSGTGVKCWCKASLPKPGYKTRPGQVGGKGNGKSAGIEVYSQGRYFAVTGWRMMKYPKAIREVDLSWLIEKYFPEQQATTHEGNGKPAPLSAFERACRYVDKMPPAISGQRGHDRTFRVACILRKGFGLDEEQAMQIMRRYNQRCQPPWTEKELRHKVQDAGRVGGPVGYMLGAIDEDYSRVRIPRYKWNPPKRRLTLHDAALKALEQYAQEEHQLISTGLPPLDSALGGGLDFGEVVIVAGRPSHGKSVFGLQMSNQVALLGHPALFVSEEMSALAVGKRMVQYVSDQPVEYWPMRQESVKRAIDDHFQRLAPILLVESCGTVESLEAEVKRAVEESSIRCVVIDYAQLLRSRGKNRYEQITNTSIAIRELTTKYNLLTILLCQLSRDVERRERFEPTLSDLRDSGQLEQDADVIMFVVWPWKQDDKQPQDKYHIFVAKNRNRPITTRLVNLKFNPARQRIAEYVGGGRRQVEPEPNPWVDEGITPPEELEF